MCPALTTLLSAQIAAQIAERLKARHVIHAIKTDAYGPWQAGGRAAGSMTDGSRGGRQTDIAALENEIAMMSMSKHDNIVEYIESYMWEKQATPAPPRPAARRVGVACRHENGCGPRGRPGPRPRLGRRCRPAQQRASPRARGRLGGPRAGRGQRGVRGWGA